MKPREAVKPKYYQHVSSREAVLSTKIKVLEFLEIKSSKWMNSKNRGMKPLLNDYFQQAGETVPVLLNATSYLPFRVLPAHPGTLN